MADKHNNNTDDINEFFAQFDKATENSRPSDPAGRSNMAGSSAGRQESYGATRASRSEGRSGSRSQKRSKAAEFGKKPSKKRGSSGSGNDKMHTKTSSGKFTALKVAGLLVLAIVMAVGIYVGVIFATAPKVNTDDIYSQLSQRSIIYDANGKEIENLYFSDGNRTIVDYDDIPEDMVNAVIAIEDKKFWKHNGFNFIRMIGAVKDSVFGGGQISGTSTVTQQLARNVYLADIKSQRSLNRKISEMYCTIVLEKNLTKEEIMEAYLNTIYLGFNSYGIQAASQAYFSKDVKDMDTLECASLAALPQSPDTYALVKADYDNSNTSLPAITTNETATYLYNGDLTKDRRDMILKNMYSEGFITSEELETAQSSELKDHMKLGISSSAGMSSYFTDYAVSQLIDDIVSEYGVSEAEAQDMVYTGGLEIYTTMDSEMQSIVEEEFKDSSNFASVYNVRTDKNDNLLSDSGEILLYDYDDYFNDNMDFTLKSGEYSMESDGSMKILKGKRLNIYEIEVNGQPDVSIEFKGMYTKEDGAFYSIESGALSIPQGYKTVDSNGNAIISAQFFSDYPEFFVKSGDNYVVSKVNYSLKQKIRQPQAAMVIMENATGEIKAMMGGRGATGKQLYNRAINPRQPGSSIKPIGVYGPALQMSYEYEKDGKTMNLDNSEGSNWGKYITAGSVINDAAIRFNGRVWPKNFYAGYRGQMTFRTALQQSVNVCAVKIYQQIGADYSSSMLKKVGISTFDDEGEVNDLNPAAIALGGMSNGITPLDLTAAYATFPSGGEYKAPIAYTKVLNSEGEVLFEKSAEGEQVYDEGVAWIMTDILQTVVTRGIAGNAAIGSQPVGGKTGTTDNNYDAWFAGFTPQYSAALWMGNDVNIELSMGSAKSADFWSNIMGRVCKDLPRGSFKERPSNVVTANGEYYTEGTYSRVSMKASKTDPTTTAPTTAPPTTENNTVTTAPPTESAPSTDSSSSSGTSSH